MRKTIKGADRPTEETIFCAGDDGDDDDVDGSIFRKSRVRVMISLQLVGVYHYRKRGLIEQDVDSFVIWLHLLNTLFAAVVTSPISPGPR
jgi:hypothetical protein